mgnify:CR=1 FL=1
MARGAAAVEEVVSEDTEIGSGWRVVLFNCECHTFDEVEKILLTATKCSLSQARAWSWEVHTKGSSVVYRGSKELCEHVADVIGSVGLQVSVSH